MVEDAPGAGKRVRQVTTPYRGTQVYHTLYLPVDWHPPGEQDQARYPLIVEYAGNGPYHNAFGDTCSGQVLREWVRQVLAGEPPPGA